MARRRRPPDRPYDALRRAAEAHARLTRGEEPDVQAGASAAAAVEPREQSRRAKAQRRGEGGKFA
ncbi:MAG: hypothetical protein DMD33_00880 [Gemmatimonadetes bacterium]|nr:MAG: hypothetical protein DMD33_00880 [Gemmatimonadota bacterium]